MSASGNKGSKNLQFQSDHMQLASIHTSVQLTDGSPTNQSLYQAPLSSQIGFTVISLITDKCNVRNEIYVLISHNIKTTER